jgi:aldose sugar dehydrogenase
MYYFIKISILIPFASMFISACAQQNIQGPEPTNNTQIQAELVVGGLSIPWGMEFLPDGSMIISEINGDFIHYKDGAKTMISGMPEVYVRGQGGFMDILLHPNYTENGWIYISYSSPEGDEPGGNTAVARFKLNNNTMEDFEVLYKANPNSTRAHHFGSRMAFDNDGHLYFSIGDRGDRDSNPQDVTRDGGKVYRIHDDGRIPADNPFVGVPNAKEATWTYGNRNIQGMVKHFETGEIWTHEHGPRGGDEINIARKGRNYGWPIITYGIEYSGLPITDEREREGMEQPLYYWVPSIAPCGMEIVNSAIYPEWKGNVLAGSLVFQYLERLVIENNKVVHREKLLDGIGRLRNVKQGPDGYIYVAVETKGIFRLLPQ